MRICAALGVRCTPAGVNQARDAGLADAVPEAEVFVSGFVAWTNVAVLRSGERQTPRELRDTGGGYQGATGGGAVIEQVKLVGREDDHRIDRRVSGRERC